MNPWAKRFDLAEDEIGGNGPDKRRWIAVVGDENAAGDFTVQL